MGCGAQAQQSYVATNAASQAARPAPLVIETHFLSNWTPTNPSKAKCLLGSNSEL